MSEEILKALMQLFAIIAKQDDGASLSHRLFVYHFLKSQLASDKVEAYMELYDSFINEGKPKVAQGNSEEGEVKEKRLTSVKDSVRTLGICKKINKTLSQKQKVVVLVRLLEMLKKENQFTSQRIGIIDTVSDVFNIQQEELELIRVFIMEEKPTDLHSEGVIIINASSAGEGTKHFLAEGLDGTIAIVRVKSVELYFAKYSGHNSISINGLPLDAGSIYLFAPGSNIRLPQGTLYYSDVVSKFRSEQFAGDLTFTTRNLCYKFPNGKPGLRDINLSEKLGKMVAIMGASGAGKTTLLNVFCGLEKPSSGKVLINGISLHNEPGKLEGVIGYISQDDLLIEELSVFENLYYNAKLCFANLDEQSLRLKAEHTLNSLGLLEVRHVKVGSAMDKKISGGQRKRLNIALELIREPAILFVDEPTSGLSSADSENVMDLFKELSIKGKLIFVVIHQPSSDIYKMFDKLVLLDVGGFQVYYGNPVDAIAYLKAETSQVNGNAGECHACGTVNPELIFNLLEAKVVDEYGNFLPDRKIKPEEWNGRFLKRIVPEVLPDGNSIPPKAFVIPQKIKQLWVFLKRDVASKLANRQYMLINLLEAPLLAALLAFVIKFVSSPETGTYIFRENENIPAYLFICVIVSLFIGLTVSAEEIFRDRKILKREKFLNLSKLSYLSSKLCILFTISAIQSALFVIIGNSILGIKGMFVDYWLVLFSVACFANILGLNISVSFNSAVTIYILIPLLVIPQLIFGGAMFNFDKLNYLIGGGRQRSPLIADAFASRWAFEALIVNQYKENEFEKNFYPIHKKESAINYKQAYFLPKVSELIANSKNLLKEDSEASRKQLEQNLELVKSSIQKELEFQPALEFSIEERLNADSVNKWVLIQADLVIEKINDYYIGQYNEIEAIKEGKINRMQDSPENMARFAKLKDDYTNDYLTDIVRKSTEKAKVKVADGIIIQNLDPVFLDPQPSSIIDCRAHFYAPRKHFLGKFYTTFSFNLMMIWLMAVLLFITLYFEIFRKLMALPSSLGIRLSTNK
jgi:ABC transport system ATP-binding/permease protein